MFSGFDGFWKVLFQVRYSATSALILGQLTTSWLDTIYSLENKDYISTIKSLPRIPGIHYYQNLIQDRRKQEKNLIQKMNKILLIRTPWSQGHNKLITW